MAAATTFAKYPFLAELGLAAENLGTWNGQWIGSGDVIKSINPSTGETIAHVKGATKAEYEATVQAMLAAKKIWQDTPMPIRGNVVRDIGEALRLKKRALAELISLEMGKILVEAEGEVQEFIDVCELAVGLSRTINGNIFPSERAGHVIMEMWHPLGLVGIITAFNFPCAVYGWNISLSLVCGNCNLWKGASSTSLVTLATTRVVVDVLAKYKLPGAIAATVSGGGRDVGELLIQDKRLGLISFTGSTAIGTRISTAVHSRFGRTILELGGNNALIVLEDADLELALRSVTFAAVGTAGQRCTTVRRLVLHEKIYDEFVARLLQTYKRIRIGDPRDPATFVGPLHTAAAVRDYQQGIEKIKAQGGKVLHGGQKVDGPGFFVEPTLVAIDEHAHVLQEELFAPVLYVIKCKDVDHAIAINNGVPQGLSSSLFSRNMQHVFKWTSHAGSDCGIVNVNVPTNGAEIGGAFGGEKETGGGRESGSDSWKQYMRRSTVTLNYSNNMPLAQGISFEP